MSYLVVALVAGAASCLTFFAGFGLGTLLLPAFALFFPVPIAVVLTACVHLLNGLFKLVLVGRHADRQVVLRFGLPAILAALAGAKLLSWLSSSAPLATYTLRDRAFEVTPVKLVIAALMAAFALVELSRRVQSVALARPYLPLGGVISGFFGGLSGHQGAFRSVFLLRAGLDKDQLIGTGVVIAVLIDLSRLSIYASADTLAVLRTHGSIVLVGTATAFLGAYVGSRLLPKVTVRAIQLGVGVLLLLFAVALGLGLL